MTKEIEIFVPGLPHIQGWNSLNRQEQDQLLHETSELQQFRQMKGIGTVGECRKLFLIQEWLQGKGISMRNYLATVYGKSARSGWKALSQYRELSEVMSPEYIDVLMAFLPASTSPLA